MTREFIELPEFENRWKALGLMDDELYELQVYLSKYPDSGIIMQGTGGIRKVRWALPGRGKSGSIRVIYLDIVISEKIYLLTVFPKNVQSNLNDAQKNNLKKLVETLKGEQK